ncbi:MAG TPA: GNAT family N-acetyltransferase [Candidatus Limnocylindria bacterium]|nr:GNAT family N-acetyltransferase [Candidatus Limnocylindria bacterium]
MGGHRHHGEAAVEITIERAQAADADTLTRLAHAAKRHWRYAEADIARWRDALTLTPGFIARHPVYAARAGGDIVGVYALTGAGATRVLEHFWVAPAHIGTGIGRRLLAHATTRLRAEGVTALRIESDPHAEGFYLKAGARRVGEVPSTPAGRTLPLLVLTLA